VHDELTGDELRSEHTLPVTALYCGVGLADPLVASVSLDRSCKIYSLTQGAKSETNVRFPLADVKHALQVLLASRWALR